MKNFMRNGLLIMLGLVSIPVVHAANIIIHNSSTKPLWIWAQFSNNCSAQDYRTNRYGNAIAADGGTVTVPAEAGCTLQAIHFNPTQPQSDFADYQGYTTIGMPVGESDVHFYIHTVEGSNPLRPSFFVDMLP